MRFLILITFSLTLVRSHGQGIDAAFVKNLEKNQLYILAQAHNNKANTILENELLLALNKKYNVRYDIIEYAHSAAFLVNQYLLSGHDSLLSFINPEANFSFIKSIKAHNDSLSSERKIWFYGIDFENRHEGKYTKRAIAIILEKSTFFKKDVLYSILRNITTSATKYLSKNLLVLRNYLATHEDECRQTLGRHYIDVLLIANAQFDFTSKRDEAMINNFKRLHKELERTGETPLFFSSLGTGHVNPNNNNGIAMKLLNDESSPVKNNVSVFGIQYLNCRFNKERTFRSTEGSLNFLCKSVAIQNLPSARSQESSITFLKRNELDMLNCKKVIGHFAGLFVVRNFDASSFWIWE